MPGYLSEVHHCEEWAGGGHTNIDKLTFGYGQHHALLGPGGWRTRTLKDGSTQWIPPPHLPLAGGTNDYSEGVTAFMEKRKAVFIGR